MPSSHYIRYVSPRGRYQPVSHHIHHDTQYRYPRGHHDSQYHYPREHHDSQYRYPREHHHEYRLPCPANCAGVTMEQYRVLNDQNKDYADEKRTLRRENRTLKRDLESLTQREGVHRASHDRLRKENDRLRVSLSNDGGDMFRRRIAELNEEVAGLNEAVARLNKQVDEKNRKVQRLEDEHKDDVLRMNTMTNTMSASADKVTHLRSKVERWKERSRDFESRYKSECRYTESCDAHIKELRAKVQYWRDKVPLPLPRRSYRFTFG
ncbi:hypothetical protein F4778DRAFT_298975 [Xylariomycetidae sp. FL2044]|nr:hypothetical protein F4778DRAFT_298975 [Xylariomycetidae sp. FL2044]